MAVVRWWHGAVRGVMWAARCADANLGRGVESA